ncbi:MAG: hypothetical protein A2X12_11420 [Bacteroidetes bacterium GWE2_29_8]|nr:MAG: hypothetical protein A2X12_11420 [Bacteroidetes bacterium GWE2_29_8]
MFGAISQGIILGVTLAFLIGPSFFALLQTSIKHGFKIGFSLATGIFLSDLFCIALIFIGLARFVNEPSNRLYITIAGGFVLIIIGISTIIMRKKHIKDNDADIEIKTPKIYLYIIKGFLLNMLNPSVYIYWISIVAISSAQYGHEKYLSLIFLASILSAVYLTDSIKAYLANKLKKILNDHIILIINLFAGILLIIIGLVLILKSIM